MAELFQPMLSPVSGSTFVRTPVEDTSTAETIEAVGKTGMEAWKGYEESRLAGPDIIDTSEEVSFADVRVDQAKGTAEVSPTTVLNLNKIAAGRKQGKISAAEARILVTSAVKEASSRMPGMAESFRRQAAEFFGAYAPGWGLLEDEPERKSAEEKRKENQEKQMLDVAKTVGGGLYARSAMLYGTPEEREAWVQEYNSSPEVKMWTAGSQYKSMLGAQESLLRLDKPRQNAAAPLYVASRATDLEANLTPVLNNIGISRINDLHNISDLGKRQDAKIALQQWKTAELSQYNRDFPEADPANREALSGLLNGVVTKLELAIDGKAKDEAAEDAIKAYKRAAFWEWEKHQPGMTLYFTGIGQFAPNLLNGDGPIAQAISNKIKDTAATAFERFYKFKDIGSPASPYDGTHAPEAKEFLIDSAKDAVSRIESGPKPDGWQQVELDFLTSVVKGMENPANRREITQAEYKKIFDLYTTPNWNELKKGNSTLAEEIENRLADGIDDYAVRAGRSLAQWASSNPSLANKVELGVTSDGRLMFIPATNIPVSSSEYKSTRIITDDLNDRYQFGTMAKAWSNVFQRPQSELLKELSSKGYFPTLKMRSIE